MIVVMSVVSVGLCACQAIPMSSDGAEQAVHMVYGDNDISQGVLPHHVSAFDEELPGIGNLDPILRAAVQNATEDAREENVDIFINSGWRSPELQNQILEEAIAEYGSREEAARWVATAETSSHVSGHAVDIGEMDAYLWLSERDRGAAYGLCQIYSNEPWHFEYIPEALEYGCPTQYLDPTYDPRLDR